MDYLNNLFNLKNKVNKWITLAAGSLIKALFLFAVAFAFFRLGIVPKLFLITMGIFQLYTAVAGGILALGIQAVKKKFAQHL